MGRPLVTVQVIRLDGNLAAVAALGLRGYLRALAAAGKQEPEGLAALVDELARGADTNRHGLCFVESDAEDGTRGDLLTVARVARLLGCSTRTVERRITAGELPAMKTGRIVRIRSTDLAAYLEDHAA